MAVCLFSRNYRHIRFVVSFLSEGNRTVNECIQRMISSHSDIQAGIVNSTALTNQNVTGLAGLSAIQLHAKALAL